MDAIIKKLRIDETYTKPIKKAKIFTKVIDQALPMPDFNFMADLLFLPTDKKGNKFCLAVCDLANGDFDIEAIQNKEPETVLKAMKKMFTRKFIKKPYASIRTDGGTEFKGVFHKYLYDESILHRVALPDRHSQLANIDNLNKQLGRLFNGYMNTKELETKKEYREWTDIIDDVRKELNIFRHKNITKDPFTMDMPAPQTTVPNKYNVGDLVYRQLEIPRNALGDKQSTKSFRMGDFRYDFLPRKVLQVLTYSGKVPYRYIISGLDNVSYTEAQLLPSREKEELYVVKQIIGKKKVGNKIQYLIWWQDYKKAEATWEPRSELMKTVAHLVNEYEKSI